MGALQVGMTVKSPEVSTVAVMISMCDRHKSNNFMFVLKRGSMLLDWNPPAAKDNFFHKYSNVELFASLVSSEEGPNLRMEKPNSSDRSLYNSSVDIKVIQ